MKCSTRLRIPALAIFLTLPGAAQALPDNTSCTVCHSSTDWFDEAGIAIARSLHEDVHGEAGLSCHDCHGGNPALEFAEDLDGAMDEDFALNPYRGALDKADIPALCGRCHSDPEYMKRFDPAARVDQVQEYWTSRHGQALQHGDVRVASCTDCHGAHGIVSATNPTSPVYPSNVAQTCDGCHGDPEHMAGYTTADGRPLPTDPFEQWRRSVHGAAMLIRGDLSAPTCNDCHGNHGATPPGLDSITFVCGQCHGREADLFRASKKQELLLQHNDYLEGVGGEGCALCHESPEPAAELTAVTSFTDCTTCHGNHGVARPTVAMLSPLPEAPCAFCHEGEGPLAETVPEPEKKARNYQQTLGVLLGEAGARGLEGDERFDYLVDAALTLPNHTEKGEQFERLFEKFRIGKIRIDEHRETLRCGQCHAEEPLLAGEAVGYRQALQMVEQMHELTALTARAERILLSARRGGVETRHALEKIEEAVKAQIELEVLVHSFATGEDSTFQERQKEGLESAQAALLAGREALGELAFRRQGLIVALFLIVLVLVGLALKIRQLSGQPLQGAGNAEHETT